MIHDALSHGLPRYTGALMQRSRDRILTTHVGSLPRSQAVAQRIVQFADIVGSDRVIAGTDCGFGTFAGIGKMDAEISFKKLGALVDGAKLASKRLWQAQRKRDSGQR